MLRLPGLQQQKSVDGSTMKYPLFEYFVKGGLQHGRVYLLAGPPGSGKSILCAQLITQWVKGGKEAWVVAIGPDSHQLCENLSQQGLKDDPRLHILFDGSDLEPASLAQIFGSSPEARTGGLVVLDSMTPVIGSTEPGELLRSFDSLLKDLRKTNSIALLTLEAGMHDRKVMSTLCYLADGVFYVRLQGKGKQISRQIAIRRLRGIKHSRAWHMLEFHKDHVLVARSAVYLGLLKLSLAPAWKVMLGSFSVSLTLLYGISFLVTNTFADVGRTMAFGVLSGVASGAGSLLLTRLSPRRS